MQIEDVLIKPMTAVLVLDYLRLRPCGLCRTVAVGADRRTKNSLIFGEDGDFVGQVAAVGGKLQELVARVFVILLEGSEIRTGAEPLLEPPHTVRRSDRPAIDEFLAEDSLCLRAR